LALEGGFCASLGRTAGWATLASGVKTDLGLASNLNYPAGRVMERAPKASLDGQMERQDDNQSPNQLVSIGRGLDGYQAALDGMRAIAVTAVVFIHASPWMPGGFTGVDIFFVLSGFLITTLIVNEINQSGRMNLRQFYIRRILRLAPAFYLLIGVSVVLSIFSKTIDLNLRATLLSAAYLMNWNRAFGLYPETWLGHTWSLAMEEQFYILWPCTLILILRRRPLIWIMSAIVIVTAWRTHLVLAGADPERTYNGFDTHSDALLIGCALSLWPARGAISDWAAKLAVVPVCALALIFATLAQRTAFAQIAGLPLASLAAAWLIVASLRPGWLRAILSIAPLTYTGRISYGWYLWHAPLIVICKAHFPEIAGLNFVVVPASYLVAVMSYHFVERPFLRLKARFEPTAARRQQQRVAVEDYAAESAS
jgi:peptidoglycan/LPS O-acetylase OafA/YrhL